jgi:hypothetical protein
MIRARQRRIRLFPGPRAAGLLICPQPPSVSHVSLVRNGDQTVALIHLIGIPSKHGSRSMFFSLGAHCWTICINSEAGQTTLKLVPSNEPPAFCIDFLLSLFDGPLWQRMRVNQRMEHLEFDSLISGTGDLRPAPLQMTVCPFRTNRASVLQ